MARGVPAHAARLLAPEEGVRYVTRPRLMSLDVLLVMTAVVLGLVLFSMLVEPGFIRLLSLPAFPLLGGFAGRLTLSPVIFVTDRRLVFARRFCKPLSLDLERLKAIRVQQKPLGRLLRYGNLVLLFQPLQDLGEGVFIRFKLEKLPDAVSLGSAISAAAGALGIDVAQEVICS
jgi:hypothetical protein